MIQNLQKKKFSTLVLRRLYLQAFFHNLRHAKSIGFPIPNDYHSKVKIVAIV